MLLSTCWFSQPHSKMRFQSSWPFGFLSSLKHLMLSWPDSQPIHPLRWVYTGCEAKVGQFRKCLLTSLAQNKPTTQNHSKTVKLSNNYRSLRPIKSFRKLLMALNFCCFVFRVNAPLVSNPLLITDTLELVPGWGKPMQKRGLVSMPVLLLRELLQRGGEVWGRWEENID